MVLEAQPKAAATATAALARLDKRARLVPFDRLGLVELDMLGKLAMLAGVAKQPVLGRLLPIFLLPS